MRYALVLPDILSTLKVCRDCGRDVLVHSSLFTGEELVLRHRHPVTHPFPNKFSHPLPRFSYDAETGQIVVTFSTDPSYPTEPDLTATMSLWKDKTYVLSSIPLRKPRTIIDDASQAIASAITMPFTLLTGRSAAPATPDAVFSSGYIDLREDEILESERSEEGEVDDSPEKLRDVRVVGLSQTDMILLGDKAKARQQWVILPIRKSRRGTGH